MLDWILAGFAATYLHKKFPKQTEAVAKGVLKATEFVARKAYEGLSKDDGPVIEAQAIGAVETRQQPQLDGGAEDWQAAIISPLHEGLALTLFRSRFRRGAEAYGYTDQRGRTVIPPQFSAGGGFSNGLAAVRPVDNRPLGVHQPFWGYGHRGPVRLRRIVHWLVPGTGDRVPGGHHLAD